MRTRANRRFITAAVVAALTLGSLSTAALAADARTAKDALADDIEALAPSGNKKVDAKITQAAKTLRSGLASKHWVDDATPDGTGTFRADARAVRALNQVVRQEPGLNSAVRPLQTEVAAIDHDLAYDRILSAAAAGADDDQLARAYRQLSKGDLFASQNKFSKAVRSYLRAWRIATSAMEAVPAVGG